jgi:N-carbamoyl-L-amino-acid hydrolase
MTQYPSTLQINSKRLLDDFNELADIGATVEGGVSRLALSNEDLEARAWFANKIEESGLMVRDDDVGNLSGVLYCDNMDAKTFLMGSHLDTVQNAGLYDGALGVLTALEIIRTVKDAGLQLPVHLEAIDFTDEEGTWQSFFGSLGLTGNLSEKHVNDAEQDNAAFRVALFRAGIRPSEVHRAKRNSDNLAGYLELHIEQGERLARAGNQIGIVTGIVGRSTYNFVFYGEATHAATTAPDKRRDALQGAAVFITEIHRIAREDYPDGNVNCGNVLVEPGTFNQIPSKASLQVEMRHPDEAILSEMESRIIRLAHDVARDYRLSVAPTTKLRRKAAQMHPQLINLISDLCETSDLRSMRLNSYAGHDAQMLSEITPAGMIFVPSHGGVSHNPREFTDWEDVEAGANLMLHTMLRWVLHSPQNGTSP